MTKSKFYIIKLHPTNNFFFGGENTFGEQNVVNYFVHSNLFPQQTGVFGLIRYLLLNQDKGIKLSQHEIKDLIGEKSFRHDAKQDFGKIKGISPLFISKETNYYFLSNSEFAFDKDYNSKPVIFEFEKEGKTYTGNKMITEGIPKLTNYESKLGYEQCFLSSKGEKIPVVFKPKNILNRNVEIKDTKAVFYEDEQVGIEKNQSGKTENKSFFRQTLYKMNKLYDFAVAVELNDEMELQNDLLNFGGEQSLFEIKSEPISGELFKTLFEPVLDDKPGRLILLSDAYVENDIYKDCIFAITDTVDFRYIKSFAKGNYSDNPGKSGKFNLLKRGSVFYTKNIAKLANQFTNETNQSNFRTIGYNYFRVKYTFND